MDTEIVEVIAKAVARGHAAGVAEERARWTAAIAAEREDWINGSGNPDAAVSTLRNVLIRLGIAQ